MLWIGSGRDTVLAEEVARHTGLTATIAATDTQEWKKRDTRRCRVMVLTLPASSEFVQEVMSAAQAGVRPLPVVILDRDGSLDESLIGPSLNSFRHVVGDRSAEEIGASVSAALEAAAQKSSFESQESWNKLLVGESQPMRELRAIIRLAGPRQSTVLITGETGTGKERVAQAIHLASRRLGAPMVAVNCGALPEHLIEAELFGHTRGAFTGAVGPRVGRFEQANRGTLLLDEVGETPLMLQPKLLRVLQERELQRVGSSETVKVDARIIAASNINLEQAVAQKRFREDLYYRLNVIPIRVPTLRERRSDIPLLAAHFIEAVCQREGLPLKKLTAEAQRRLTEFEWPGNVRQLEHAMEMAAALSGERETIYLGDIESHLQPASREMDAQSDDFQLDVPTDDLPFEDLMGKVEKLLLDQALRRHGGNKAKAAKALGLKRTTLLYKLKAQECVAGAA
ncbi:MAG: sigma54 specific transcriptional regulator, Fis family [Bryobacterales bacterium]|nr:sigma54 specific transcriptional regulator, Fis family [Bryobacterales bacterium]